MHAQLASSSRERKPPKVLERIHLTKAENGGLIAEHHFTSYEHKDEPHVITTGKQLIEHVNKHMPGALSAPEESEPAAQHDDEKTSVAD